MLSSFGVKGDITGTRLNKITNQPIDWLDHQMDINGGDNAIVTQRLADHGTNSQVGYIVIVHDIKMDYVGTGGQHRIHVLAQSGKIGGQYRRGYERFHKALFQTKEPLL